MATPPSAALPAPLARRILTLDATTSGGIPKKIKATQWGSPLEAAKHVVFYFGGMPASAEEPVLHTAAAASSSDSVVEDVYASRRIHLICLDKPGMGESSFAYRFSIRRDWPQIVDQVATQLLVPQHGRYGVMGMSNGGPYVMATLTHPMLQQRVKAAAMIVGVSDPWASGYTNWKTPSTVLEAAYNSLPLVVTGPLNALGLHMGKFYLNRLGGFERVFRGPMELPAAAKPGVLRLLGDAAGTCGLGAALDCQQGLSPLFARSSKDVQTDSLDRNATDAYQAISVPVSLWYGEQDASVPMASAEWLAQQIPDSTLHKVPNAGHGLFFVHTAAILDELVQQMDKADEEQATTTDSSGSKASATTTSGE